MFQLLYLLPKGDNPTGITMPEKRRQEVYEVVCKYDLLIAEDDPYSLIQFGPKVSQGRRGEGGKRESWKACLWAVATHKFIFFFTGQKQSL